MCASSGHQGRSRWAQPPRWDLCHSSCRALGHPAREPGLLHGGGAGPASAPREGGTGALPDVSSRWHGPGSLLQKLGVLASATLRWGTETGRSFPCAAGITLKVESIATRNSRSSRPAPVASRAGLDIGPLGPDLCKLCGLGRAPLGFCFCTAEDLGGRTGQGNALQRPLHGLSLVLSVG